MTGSSRHAAAASPRSPEDWQVACVGVGSNLGDRAGHLEAAARALHTRSDIRAFASATPVETDPVGPPGQGRYLNGAFRFETTCPPGALLALLLEIERTRGRVRTGPRWGPRTLDLDLLLYGTRTIDEPGLRVPHPSMHERSFVLQPLAEIAADLVHPILDRTVGSLAEAVGPCLARQPRGPA